MVDDGSTDATVRQGRGPRPPERAADPAGERREAGGAEHRHRRRPARHPRAGRRRHRLRALGDACPRRSVRGPRGRCGLRQHQGGQPRGLLGRWQHIEYVIGFNLDRRMFDVLRCMPTVPGAIGAFRRETLAAVGGVSNDTLAEDTDLTMATCRAGWRVVYAPEARAWTEAPATLGQLWRQRYRWCYGTMQAMWKHRVRCSSPEPRASSAAAACPTCWRSRSCCRCWPRSSTSPPSTRSSSLPSPQIAYVWLGFLALQLVSAAYAFRLDGERARAAVEPGAPAVRLPPADVPRGDPVGGERDVRHPPALAGDAATGDMEAAPVDVPV